MSLVDETRKFFCVRGRRDYLDVKPEEITGVNIVHKDDGSCLVRMLTSGGVFRYRTEDKFFADGLCRLLLRPVNNKELDFPDVDLPDMFSDQVSLPNGGVLYVHSDYGKDFEALLNKGDDSMKSRMDRVQAHTNLYRGGPLQGVKIRGVRYNYPVLEVSEGDIGCVIGWVRPGRYSSQGAAVACTIDTVCRNYEQWTMDAATEECKKLQG